MKRPPKKEHLQSLNLKRRLTKICHLHSSQDIGNVEKGSVVPEWQIRISAKPGEPEDRWLEEDLKK
ncbi:hypothetical protein GH733_008776, partial [Mirounga leonina]